MRNQQKRLRKRFNRENRGNKGENTARKIAEHNAAVRARRYADPLMTEELSILMLAALARGH